MADKQYIFNKLDEQRKVELRGKSLEDCEIEARDAREALKELTDKCEEVDGVYNFAPAAEELKTSEAEVKDRIATARANFEYANFLCVEKSRAQRIRSALEAPIYGLADKETFAPSNAGGDLLRSLETIHGMDAITSKDLLSSRSSREIAGADFNDILFATTMTKGTGGSANPPTGITPNRPVNVETPYEAIDRRRNVASMLPTINIQNDQFKYRKEIDAGVGNPASQTGTYPNYNAGETALSVIQPIGSKEEVANVETLRAMVTMSVEQAKDVGAAVPYASMLLARQMSDATEAEIILGNGTSPQLRGLLNTNGKIEITKTNTTTLFDFWIAVHEKYSKPRGDVTDAAHGSGTYPAQIFFNDAEVRRMQREKDEDGRYLWGEPHQDALSHVWGTPLYVNDFIPANEALMMNIDPRYVLLVLRAGLQLDTGQNADDFARYQTSMLLHQRLTLAVMRPATICHAKALNVAKASS